MTKEEFIADYIENNWINNFVLAEYNPWGIGNYVIPHPKGNITCQRRVDGLVVSAKDFHFAFDNMELFNLNQRL